MADDVGPDEDSEDSGLLWLYGSSRADKQALPGTPSATPPAPSATPLVRVVGAAEVPATSEASRRPRRTPPPRPSDLRTTPEPDDNVPLDEPTSARVARPPSTPAVPPAPSPASAPRPKPKASRDVPGVSLLAESESAPLSNGQQRQQCSVESGQVSEVGKRHRLPRGARLTITVVVALLVGYVVALTLIPLTAWSGVARVDATPGAGHIADTPGTAILLVGSDSRDALSAEEREHLGIGQADGGRTDTMMIYFIPKTGPAVLLSLPRDTYIGIPGVGYNKLNAAYAYGGAPLLVETVEQRTGIRIDGYLEVGMAQFANLIDYVGGLDVCIDYDVADGDSNLFLDAGCHHLNGAQGLAYVRMRYADPLGDLGRVQRQREAISQVMNKLALKSNVALPWRWHSTTNALVDLLTAGEDTSIFDMLSAGWGALDFASEDGLQLTVPIWDPGANTEVGSAVIWDDDAAEELFAIIRSGDTTGAEGFVK